MLVEGGGGGAGGRVDVFLIDIQQQVGLAVHLDPPISSTVNIEPLTPEDWEIIELHANFLELNLLSQIRALPNPLAGPRAHPLTLHLSPTSTANISITSLTPAPPASSPFAKIAPDAEVIVAPKVRPRPRQSSGNRSTGSRKSSGGRSSTSTVRAARSEVRPCLYLRGVDRAIARDWFDDDVDVERDDGLRVWVDRAVLAKGALRGAVWAAVSVVRPPGLLPPVDPQQQQQQREREGEAGKLTRRIVAKIMPWEDGPDGQHAALSSLLCAALGAEGIVGGIVRVEAAPPQLHRTVKTIKVFPFISATADDPKRKDGLKFGGETSAFKESLLESIRQTYGSPGDLGFLSGPLTDGMLLPRLDNSQLAGPVVDFEGGMIRFDPPLNKSPDSPDVFGWILGSENKVRLDVQPEIPRPDSIPGEGDSIPVEVPELVAIDAVIDACMSNLMRFSSILLTGGLGSGKTSLVQLLAHTLRCEHFFHASYLSCRKLVTDEARIPTIKENITRLFLTASWCARLGGRALVILDDLDKLCPVETELQVGGENGRSRQISEIVCATAREFCTAGSNVVLLATAQAKESLNNVVVGGHVVREILSLKAPDKEGRRKVLEKLTADDRSIVAAQPNGAASSSSSSSSNNRGPLRPASSSSSTHNNNDDDSWLDPSNPASREPSTAGDGFVLARDLDFLDLAGKTDGYMPGDLELLVSRARNEALIRTIQESPDDAGGDGADAVISLGARDFDRALRGFTPASLRNVTLTQSSTTFSSIGGLSETRQVLLETLQYPTKYAPIFAQCPLRLRSGLLLYGFPGCGKTMLASAVAGECGLNFISVKGPEILNKYIGASEKSVRDLFERAEAARPCVLFFDEFDAIAPKRGHDSTGVTDRVVNQLLTQMDGAEGLSGVYVLAATSRPDLIDPALLRPGRLDKSLLCDMPSREDRVDIVRAVAARLHLAPEVAARIGDIADRTGGYSGADLQAVVYNSHLEAIHDALGDRQGQQPQPQQQQVEHHSPQGQEPQKHRPKQKYKQNGIFPDPEPPFLQFLYSPTEHALATATTNIASSSSTTAASSSPSTARAALVPNAVIAARLEDLKRARHQRQRALFGAAENGDDNNTAAAAAGGGGNGSDAPDAAIVIRWAHVERALASTRRSISAPERARLAGIYREFVVGRNGEMPSGEGGREVGGRTSLM